PLAESNFRRTLSISRNDLSVFVTSPIAATILAISLLIIIKVAYDEIRRNRAARQAAESSGSNA
ncbi:MAG TPA: C4-dicarboxylate ABC transporter permease, partial [Candidatus Avidesulfovibrio excrementigallinarum]|nr:C4-dicarboxylate ABC transporter permease [Candidatus Avidesulfovibrio excrementigallinarum]